jgi:methionine synthase II (cobalamin-independent)
VAILKDELRAASAEGASYLQIDAPRYSYFMDPKWREWIRAEMRVLPEALHRSGPTMPAWRRRAAPG